MNRLSNLLFAAGLLIVFVVGVGVRVHVFNAQSAPGWSEVPFTMESALHYRSIRQLVEGGGIPRVDHSVQYPDGVQPAKTYSLSDEYLVAGLIKLFPEHGSLTARIRWISRVWFCLGIPLLGIWVAVATRSRWAGFVASAFYAVMLASVIRSTGQELSRENFALPLLISHLLLNALALRFHPRPVSTLLGLCSGVLLGLALFTWDLIQFYIMLSWLILAIQMIFGRSPLYEKRNSAVPLGILATLAVALLSPYQRAHGLLFSPIFMLGVGIMLVHVLQHVWPQRQDGMRRCSRRLLCAKLAVLLVPLMLALFWGGEYGKDYGHFIDLLIAKLRFFNVKPPDPSMLNYDARIMWVPGLNSATVKTVFIIFPYAMLLTIILPVLLFRQFSKDRGLPDGLLDVIVLLVSSFVAFLLFVRFHVFLAIFVAAAIGYLFSLIEKGSVWKRYLTRALLILFLFGEFQYLVASPERWGRPMVYYGQMRELIDWVSGNIEGKPILANFGTSSAVLAYAGNPIVLHPKFETSEIRSLVQEYGTIMFKGDEHQLRNWMERNKTKFLIYGMGEFSDFKPEWQMRYFVDALNPPDSVPAKKFEYTPSDMQLFKQVWGNSKYRVFELRTHEDESRARSLLERARKEFQNGRVRAARDSAAKAVLLDPNRREAFEILQKTGSLLDNGFGD